MATYSVRKKLVGTFDNIVSSVKEALGAEGFGVLTEIDVTQTLKKKLGVDYQNYVILGACHPQSAYTALQHEQEIGLLLPCNVIVYETGGNVVVAAIKPTVAMQVIDNPTIKKLAHEVEQRLQRVIDRLR